MRIQINDVASSFAPSLESDKDSSTIPSPKWRRVWTSGSMGDRLSPRRRDAGRRERRLRGRYVSTAYRPSARPPASLDRGVSLSTGDLQRPAPLPLNFPCNRRAPSLQQPRRHGTRRPPAWPRRVCCQGLEPLLEAPAILREACFNLGCPVSKFGSAIRCRSGGTGVGGRHDRVLLLHRQPVG